jgi:acetyl esterase/lipase
MVRRSWFLPILMSIVTFSVPTSAGAQEGAAVAASCGEVVYTPPTASRPKGATLCLPADGTTSSSTAVVLVHGGGGHEGSRSDLRAWQDHYAAQGVVTLSIDYALVADADEDGLYPLAEQNAKAAVQYVRLRGEELGVEHVVIQGHSAGARLAAIVATSAGDAEFQGPELWLGVSDAVDGFIGFYGYYEEFQYEHERYYGTEDEPFVAIERAQQATGPALLVHGTADDVVGASESWDLAAALAAGGRSAQLELVPSAGHGFDGYEQDVLSDEGERVAEVVDRWLQQIPSAVTGSPA